MPCLLAAKWQRVPRIRLGRPFSSGGKRMANRVSAIEILGAPPQPFFCPSFQRMSRLRLRPNTAAQSALYVFSDN